MADRHTDGGPPGVEALLGAALRPAAVDAEAERRAAVAFRGARDAGALRARTRRRDDWRPRERGRMGRSARATVAMLLVSLTLGGVAVAAIGAVGSSGEADVDRHRSDATAGPAVRTPSATASVSSGPASPGRPATAKDILAHCRAYESVKDHGKALDATAWQRLVTAAGGEDDVAAYCAAQMAAAAKDGKASKAPKPEKPQKPEGTAKASKTAKAKAKK